MNILKSYTFIVSLFLFLFFSCSKDDPFVNLSSTISGETTLLGVTEGQAVIVNVNLNKELSEDLPLKVTVDTEGVEKYINEEDYDNYFEYSNDQGQNWERANGSRVVFAKRTVNLKIRLGTKDDGRLEMHEEFNLKVEPQPTAKNLTIGGSVPSVKVTVQDNEPNEESGGALFERDDQGNFKMLGICRECSTSRKFKEMVDTGHLDPKVAKDINTLVSVTKIPIKNFDAAFDPVSGLGGYVNNANPTQDHWDMSLNLAFAYHDFTKDIDINTGLYPEIAYNANGIFGYILTHEFGHIMTLNLKDEIDHTIDEESCTNTFYITEGCTRPDAALNLFHKAFYDTDEIIPEPTHVSDYAKTNIAEDIAESFAHYVTQDKINPAVAGSSGALRKINAMKDHPRLTQLREAIRGKVNIDLPSTQSEILEFNRTYNGQRISCLNHEAIHKAQKEGKFKLK